MFCYDDHPTSSVLHSTPVLRDCGSVLSSHYSKRPPVRGQCDWTNTQRMAALCIAPAFFLALCF
ncbi:hypothetical protein BaRGS_00025127, partial [Batillaria attramentaria]